MMPHPPCGFSSVDFAAASERGRLEHRSLPPSHDCVSSVASSSSHTGAVSEAYSSSNTWSHLPVIVRIGPSSAAPARASQNSELCGGTCQRHSPSGAQAVGPAAQAEGGT